MKATDRRETRARCFIIAEAGVNHNGDLVLAKQLVDAAARAGADAVKFQAFHAEEIVSPAAPKADYQLARTSPDESQLSMLRKLELSADQMRVLCEYCAAQNILFLATPFDAASVDFLDSLNVPCFKMASGEITNVPLLRHVAGKGRKVILSTGMSTLDEVAEALQELAAFGCEDVTLLHCVTEYPAPPDQVNLLSMLTMRDQLRRPVGFSDHTAGIEISFAAVALGACVIEKHLTLSRQMEGPDHRASLEPDEFSAMVGGIRNIEAALGDGIKSPAACETANRLVARRSLVASVAIPAHTVIRADMIACRRPGTGILPKRLTDVVGRRTTRSFVAGELIEWQGLDAG